MSDRDLTAVEMKQLPPLVSELHLHLCSLCGPSTRCVLRHNVNDVYLSDAATHDHIPGCDANCFGAETCMGSAEPVPGRWVTWCVEHKSTKDRLEDRWCRMDEIMDRHDCVWHPQGAFIPGVADDE